MSVYTELQSVIENMESDLGTARVAANRPYLNDYEQGFADGVVESMEASLQLIKVISNKLSWETPTPPTPRGGGEWGDVPPARTGMGG